MMWERLRRSGSRVSSATLISRRQSSPTQNGQDRFTDPDPRLAQLDDDPRSKDSPLGKAQRAALGERLSGRNSASFDPKSTLVRPAMRVLVGSSQLAEYKNELRHDDVVIVPDFYCAEDDWQVYYDLIREMRKLQEKKIQDSQWKSWHEGAHLLSPNPEGSKTYQKIIARMCEYFSIAPGTRGTRFNWYRDGSDWKPFHHDSAAFNAKRARNQNCTVGISFGASRELAFRHANNGDLVYFPQTNGMLFFFRPRCKHSLAAWHQCLTTSASRRQGTNFDYPMGPCIKSYWRGRFTSNVGWWRSPWDPHDIHDTKDTQDVPRFPSWKL